MSRTVTASVICTALVLAGCDGAARATAPHATVPAGTETIATLRGTVDLVAGTLTFESVSPRPTSLGGASAVSARVYGDQGVTVRIYNSQVVVTNPSSPGKKRYTANVGVRNLQPFPIGDEQGGVSPVDTSGLFVFMDNGPFPTGASSPCSPACSVTVANAHGRLSFDGLVQSSYWYWKDRLTAAGGARDTTLNRVSWSFEADTQVTGFTFDVLVAAAWPAPHDTRWKTEMPGDSLPHLTTEPRWIREAVLGSESVAADPTLPGSIRLTAVTNGSQSFERRDSIGPASNVYMEASVRLNSAPSKPEISFGFYDGTRFIGVGLSGTRVGFVDPGFNGNGLSVLSATQTLQTYRIVKFGSDSVQLRVNGQPVLSRLYSSFTIVYPVTYSFFEFGNPGPANQQRSQSGNSSTWDYVIYEIGATGP